MAGMDKRTKIRALFILGVFTFLVLALLVRVFWIQIVNGEWYKSMVSAQNTRNRVISAKRGKIYDRNNHELAVNVPVNNISVNPAIIRKSWLGTGQISKAVSEILQVDEKGLYEKFEKPDQYELIKRKASSDASDRLKQWAKENNVKGIYFEQDVQRYYPGKNLAAHVLGFTGTDNQGLSGVELSMEKYLKGMPGKESEDVDAKGIKLPFSGERLVNVNDGLNVVLTLDENIQRFAENELQAAIDQYKVLGGGTVIVMDPNNGDILAMVSKPDFDLNNPFAVPKDMPGADINELQKRVWTNKALSSTYEPGSTFKLITAAAALEEGTIAPDSEVVDAPVKVAGWTINSAKPGGHGKETFSQSVYNSDNPVFVKLSQVLGIDRFYSYVRAFGFYDRTGIELPGEAGSIFQAKPAEIDMAAASFGQSFQITPIQLMGAYTAIENGGKLVKPRIVKELTGLNNNVVREFEPEVVRNVISKRTSETLRNIMEGVVRQGTGSGAYIKGYTVAGKTGTSETIENGVRSKERYIASFMGFAPADAPLVSVLVILDHPTGESHLGGTVAAPVAAKIIEYALGYLGVEKVNN